MTRSKAPRTRLGALLALALGAIALLAMPGLATAKDRNHDRIPDRWEKRHKLSLKVNQARRDQDHDRMRNLAEFKAGFDPRDRDSDDDGVKDADENAGTIASFDAATGKLTINLFGGDTVGGLVTGETRIECGGGCDEGSGASVSSDDHSGPSEHGDSSEEEGDDQPSDDDSSDDHGEHSSEHSGPGDDEQASSCTTADLVVGAVVEEAELRLANGVATFEEIELEDGGGSAAS